MFTGDFASGTLVPREEIPEDLGVRVDVTCWTLVAVSSIFLGVRVYCKFTRHRGLWWDDWILIASWLMLVARCSVTSYNITKGFGMHVDDIPEENLSEISLLINIGGFFSIISIIWSKTSFAVTLLRITDGWTRHFVWFTIISINIAMGISALLVWAQCMPVAKAWKPFLEGECMDKRIRSNYGLFASVYSGVMDITLSLLPWKLVWNLQMRTKEKVGVGLAMTMGIFAGATAFVKASKLHTLRSGDFSYFGSQLVIWAVAEASTTIIAASIPILRALFADIRSSTRKYYGSGQQTGRKTRTNQSIVITANRNGGGTRGTFAKADDRSDKSILAPGSGKILQTNEITLEYTSRSLTDGESVGFEMEKVDNRDRPHA